MEWQFAKKEKLLDEIDNKRAHVDQEPEYVPLDDLEDEEFKEWFDAHHVEHADEDPNELCWEDENLSKDEVIVMIQYNFQLVQAMANDEKAPAPKSYLGIRGKKKEAAEISMQTCYEIVRMLKTKQSLKGKPLSPEKIVELKHRLEFAKVLLPSFFKVPESS